jgi:hypothetical protein
MAVWNKLKKLILAAIVEPLISSISASAGVAFAPKRHPHEEEASPRRFGREPAHSCAAAQR